MAALSFLYNDKIHSLKNKSELLKSVSQHLPEQYRETFEGLAEAPAEEVREFLEDKRAELLQKVPEQYRFLFDKVGDFEQASLDLFDFTRAQGRGAGAFQLASDARLLLDRLDADELGEESRLALDAGEALLRLQLSGNLSAGADFKGGGSVLTAGVALSAATGQQLGYSVLAERRHYMLQALVQAKGLLHDPSDLAEVVKAMADSSLCRTERLSNVALSFGVSVAVGQAMEGLVEGLPIEGSAGLSLDLEYRDQADFALIVEQLRAGGYALDFRKIRRKTSSSVLKLGVDLKVTGFKDRLIEKITQVIPEDPGIRRLLTELDNVTEEVSREALTGRLKKELQDRWPQGKEVFDFLVGKESAQQLAQDIRAELQEKVEEVIETRLDLWNVKAEQAGRLVAGAIAEELHLDAKLRAKLDGYLAEAVGNAVGEFERKLGGRLDGWLGAAEGELAGLLQPWEFVGVNVAAAIEALSSNAGDKLGKAKTALQDIQARYARFRLGVLNAVKTRIEEELSLAIISRKERTLTHSHSIRFEFSAVTPAVARLYRALWLGDLRRFDELAADLHRDPAVRGLTGEYLSVAETLESFDLKLNFFGMKFSHSELFSERVEVGVDLGGQLVVAQSKAELEKRRRNLFTGEAQLLSLVWQMDHLRRQVLDAPLVIKLVLNDDKFEKGEEVDDFFGSLERIGVLREGVAAEVETTLFGTDAKAIRKAVISVNAAFRWQDWLRLVGTGLDGKPVAGAWEADAVCREYLHHLDLISPRDLRDAKEMMRNTPIDDLLHYLKWLGEFTHDNQAARRTGGTKVGSKIGVTSEFTVARRLAIIIYKLHLGLQNLQLSWRALVEELAGPARFDRNRLQALQEHMQNVNRHFARAFDPMFSVGYLLDDVGKPNQFTNAGLRLFMLSTELPNHYLACTFESERTGTLVIS